MFFSPPAFFSGSFISHRSSSKCIYWSLELLILHVSHTHTHTHTWKHAFKGAVREEEGCPLKTPVSLIWKQNRELGKKMKIKHKNVADTNKKFSHGYLLATLCCWAQSLHSNHYPAWLHTFHLISQSAIYDLSSFFQTLSTTTLWMIEIKMGAATVAITWFCHQHANKRKGVGPFRRMRLPWSSFHAAHNRAKIDFCVKSKDGISLDPNKRLECFSRQIIFVKRATGKNTDSYSRQRDGQGEVGEANLCVCTQQGKISLSLFHLYFSFSVLRLRIFIKYIN